MDLLRNLGSGELLFLILLAILLVGPMRAVEIAQQVTRFISRIRRDWQNVQEGVMTEVQSLKQDALDAGLVEEVGALQKDIGALQKDLQTQAQALDVETQAVEQETRTAIAVELGQPRSRSKPADASSGTAPG